MSGGKELETVCRFKRILDDEGEAFFTSGSIRKDYRLIVETLKTQGYWAGIKYRYYFDEEYNLLRTEERRFGA